MTEIVIESSRSVPSTAPARRTPSWSRQSLLNDRLAMWLMIVLALVPLPLASNRPFFWCLSASVIGITGAIYVFRLRRLDESFRFGLRHLWPWVVPFAITCLFLVAQALPLEAWVSAIFRGVTFDVATAASETIALDRISLAPGATWFMLLRLATYGMFFFLMLQIATNQRRKIFALHAMLAIATFYAAFGLASLVQFGDTLLGLQKWAYEGSATATFVNRNSFATFLAMGVVVALTLLTSGGVQAQADNPAPVQQKRRLEPRLALYLLCGATIWAALLATESRMGAFAAIIGSGIVLLANFTRTRDGLAKALFFTPLILIIGGAAVLFYGYGLFERLGSVEQSTDVRLDFYEQIVGMILARPWLGYGGGAFEVAFPVFHQLPVSPDLAWDRAHNTYLALWAELGLVVGSLPILMLVLATVRIVVGLRHVRPDWTAKVAALGVIAVGAIHSLVDFSLEVQANTLMFLALVAIGVAGIARNHAPGTRHA